ELRDQGLAVEVDEIVFVVHVGQRDVVGYVVEEWPALGASLRQPSGHPPSRGPQRRPPSLAAPHRESLVGRDVREQADPALATRPLDFYGVDRVAWADAEREDVVHARLETARRLLLLEELLRPAPQRDLRADGEPIGARSLEPHLQEAVLPDRPGVVAIDERLLVDVVHDQVERAVAVQVAVGRAAREARRIQAPGRTLVREDQVPPVPK